MSLSSQIVATKPREVAGARSGSRFDFQKDWSLCRLIENHKEANDYLLVFDYHEDLTELDSEKEPTKIDFYQIKGKQNGSWKITDLIRSEKSKTGDQLLSILGKLYDAKIKFSSSTTTLNFVSNARFDCLLADNTSSVSKDVISAEELNETAREKIKTKLMVEHSLSSEPTIERVIFFRVTNLSLGNSQDHAVGILARFLDDKYGNLPMSAVGIYKSLFDEIRRRANYNNADIHDFDDLVNYKSIGRSTFNRFLSSVEKVKDYDKLWQEINSELLNDGVSFADRKSISSNWKKLEVLRMNSNDTMLSQLIDAAAEIINSANQDEKYARLTLSERVDVVSTSLITRLKVGSNYDPFFIKAAVLFTLYEND